MAALHAEPFGGQDCVRLDNDALSLWVTQAVGPRVLGLNLHGAENLFAVLPEDTYEREDGATFYFRGGHRLWVAPEDPHLTYFPDNAPVTISPNGRGVNVIQPPDVPSGIRKSLHITLGEGDQACVELEHRVENLGEDAHQIAPWAITQFRPGGTAILPMSTAPADPHGLLPNRQFALWPYAEMDSPQLRWGQRYVFVDARFSEGAFKVGFPNPCGWLAYWLEGTLFVKQAAYDPQADYFDLQSSSECYANPRFLELETLGPRVVLEPGESTVHVETWRVFANVDCPADDDQVDALITRLGLTDAQPTG